MKLGILSDTHNQRSRCETAIALLQQAGAEALVHCGDFTEADILKKCAVLPCYFVLGNNDLRGARMLQEVAEELGSRNLLFGGVIELAGKTIAVTHGHLTTEMRRLAGLRPDYLLSGHTHVAADERSHGIRYINPGALHRAAEYSVGLLDLSTDELQFLSIPR